MGVYEVDHYFKLGMPFLMIFPTFAVLQKNEKKSLFSKNSR